MPRKEVDLFKLELKRQMNMYYQLCRYIDIHRGLCHWGLLNIFNKSESDCKHLCSLDSPRDLNIDAIWRVDETKTYYIVQSKDTKIKREDIDDITRVPDRLLDQGYITEFGKKELEKIAYEYRESYNRFSTKLIMLTSSSITPTIRGEIKNFNKKNVSEFKKIELICFDINELKKKYIERFKKEVAVNVSLKFNPRLSFLLKLDHTKAINLAVSGKEIAKITDQYEYNILEKNVRDYLGENPVNTRILETLKISNEKPNFWFYNNGITLICDKFKITGKNNCININNLQVVNGGQTAFTLRDALHKGYFKQRDIMLPLKVIASKDIHLIEKITEATNTQTAVDLRSLRSNDTIQKDIQNDLLGMGYYYLRKDGEKNKKLPTGLKVLREFKKDKLIDNEEASQAYLSFFLNKPVDAKAKKKNIFMFSTLGGYYNDIFDNNKNISEQLLLSYLVYAFIKNKVSIFKRSWNKLKRQQMSKKFIIYSTFQTTMYFKFIIQKIYGNITIDHLKDFIFDDNFIKKAELFYSAIIKDMGLWINEFAKSENVNVSDIFNKATRYNNEFIRRFEKMDNVKKFIKKYKHLKK